LHEHIFARIESHYQRFSVAWGLCERREI